MKTITKVEIELSKRHDYEFDAVFDAASLTDNKALLISYRTGRSVTIDLRPGILQMENRNVEGTYH